MIYNFYTGNIVSGTRWSKTWPYGYNNLFVLLCPYALMLPCSLHLLSSFSDRLIDFSATVFWPKVNLNFRWRMYQAKRIKMRQSRCGLGLKGSQSGTKAPVILNLLPTLLLLCLSLFWFPYVCKTMNQHWKTQTPAMITFNSEKTWMQHANSVRMVAKYQRNLVLKPEKKEYPGIMIISLIKSHQQ